MTSPSDRGPGSKPLFITKQVKEIDTLIKIAGDIEWQIEQYRSARKTVLVKASLITKNTLLESLGSFLETQNAEMDRDSGLRPEVWAALKGATNKLQDLYNLHWSESKVQASHMDDSAVAALKEIQRQLELLRSCYQPKRPLNKAQVSPLQDPGPFAVVPVPVFQETASESSNGKSTGATALTSLEKLENDNASTDDESDADSDGWTKVQSVSFAAPCAAE